MTTTISRDPETGPETGRNGSHTGTRAHPHRMPAMGWIRDIATSENWRTTTIVQRHRDRAATPGSL
jgi:hypothetical protein